MKTKRTPAPSTTHDLGQLRVRLSPEGGVAVARFSGLVTAPVLAQALQLAGDLSIELRPAGPGVLLDVRAAVFLFATGEEWMAAELAAPAMAQVLRVATLAQRDSEQHNLAWAYAIRAAAHGRTRIPLWTESIEKAADVLHVTAFTSFEPRLLA
jgi:hypothetical protein